MTYPGHSVDDCICQYRTIIGDSLSTWETKEEEPFLAQDTSIFLTEDKTQDV